MLTHNKLDKFLYFSTYTPFKNVYVFSDYEVTWKYTRVRFILVCISWKWVPQAINADLYIETLDKLTKEKIRFKRRGRIRLGTMRLLHDNATPYSAEVIKNSVGKIQAASITTVTIWPWSEARFKNEHGPTSITIEFQVTPSSFG